MLKHSVKNRKNKSEVIKIKNMLRTAKKKTEIEKPLTFKEKNNLYKLRWACMKNALDLLQEAEILYKNRKYSRAFSLAYTANEEVSKHQITSDYISGIIAKEELESAFRRHDIKAAYGRFKIEIGPTIQLQNNVYTSDSTLHYDTNEGRKMMSLRNNSLYVNYSNNYEPIEPRQIYKAKDAKNLIKIISERISFINWAEEFNGRIGTKALIK